MVFMFTLLLFLCLLTLLAPVVDPLADGQIFLKATTQYPAGFDLTSHSYSLLGRPTRAR
jgi:hypothetical protein